VVERLERHDLRFEDWAMEIARTMIGRDLIVRTMGVPLFYGARRPNVEAFLLTNPEFIRVGLQHFAGKRWSRRAIAAALAGASWHTLRALVGRAPEHTPATENALGDTASGPLAS
jgi:hypothetical protein